MTSTREWLVSEAYPDRRNLAARRSIYAYRTPQCDLPAVAVEQLGGVHGLVVDVGCGDGAYVRALRSARPDLTVLGLDLSPGMLAATGPPVLLADAASCRWRLARPMRCWPCTCSTTCRNRGSR